MARGGGRGDSKDENLMEMRHARVGTLMCHTKRGDPSSPSEMVRDIRCVCRSLERALMAFGLRVFGLMAHGEKVVCGCGP